ncbi:MAG: hypothetical protein IKS47_00685 [Bacteroidales bacterium]|nr:hypothetical protein [Bacteroidales bacterium]
MKASQFVEGYKAVRAAAPGKSIFAETAAGSYIVAVNGRQLWNALEDCGGILITLGANAHFLPYESITALTTAKPDADN